MTSDHEAVEEACLQYVLANAKLGDIQSVIHTFDEFCYKNWMMNVGPEKGKILIHELKTHKPKTVVEIGGYCGYSALVLAQNSPEDTLIYTVEVNPRYIQIAKELLGHAGVGHKVKHILGNVEQNSDKLRAMDKIDLLFIDHIKAAYLSDFEIIEGLGVIKKGSVVVGDNIIKPGAPDFLEYMRKNERFQSVLYHSFLEYSEIPDAVLVSVALH